jgi:hypothetical protein
LLQSLEDALSRGLNIAQREAPISTAQKTLPNESNKNLKLTERVLLEGQIERGDTGGILLQATQRGQLTDPPTEVQQDEHERQHPRLGKKLQALVQMGFSSSQASRALFLSSFELEEATNLLLENPSLDFTSEHQEGRQTRRNSTPPNTRSQESSVTRNRAVNKPKTTPPSIGRYFLHPKPVIDIPIPDSTSAKSQTSKPRRKGTARPTKRNEGGRQNEKKKEKGKHKPGRKRSDKKAESAARRGSAVAAIPMYCFCGVGEYGAMIMCTFCEIWYHAECLKIADKNLEAIEDFACPTCQERGAGQTVWQAIPQK